MYDFKSAQESFFDESIDAIFLYLRQLGRWNQGRIIDSAFRRRINRRKERREIVLKEKEREREIIQRRKLESYRTRMVPVKVLLCTFNFRETRSTAAYCRDNYLFHGLNKNSNEFRRNFANPPRCIRIGGSGKRDRILEA